MPVRNFFNALTRRFIFFRATRGFLALPSVVFECRFFSSALFFIPFTHDGHGVPWVHVTRGNPVARWLTLTAIGRAIGKTRAIGVRFRAVHGFNCFAPSGG